MILPLIERTNLLGFASRLNFKSGHKGLKEFVLKETTMHRPMGVTYRRGMYLSPATQRLVAILKRKYKS